MADPPQKLWSVLTFLQAKCDAENVEILAVFEDYGASHQGTMKREKFCTALKDSFSRCYFTQEVLDDIVAHYGVGYLDRRGTRENIAWKDFCEDLRKAPRMVRPGSPEHSVMEQARGKGHIPGRGELPTPVRGWQPEPGFKEVKAGELLPHDVFNNNTF